MPRIIVKKNGVQVDQYIVETGVVKVGRTPDNQIVLNDPSVSRSHCEIKLDDDSRRITIVDLNSSNGTYVNGIRISRMIVSKAMVGVGVYQLEVGTVESVEKPAAPPPRQDVEATVMFQPNAISNAEEQGHVPTRQDNPPVQVPSDHQDHSKKKSWLSRLLGK